MRERKRKTSTSLFCLIGERRYRKLALLLAAALLCSNMGAITPYGAEQTSYKQIEEFEKLPEEILSQQVPYGTKKKKLDLPKTLRGFVISEPYREEEDEIVTASPSQAKKHIASPSEAVRDEEDDITTATPSTATSSTAAESGHGDREGRWKSIRVSWELDETFSSSEEYDGEKPGTYVFDAVLMRDTYKLASAELPRITVEVLQNTEVEVITGWEWMDEQDVLSGNTLSLPGASEENSADFDFIVSMLPEKIKAVVRQDNEGTDVGKRGEREIEITEWSCDEFPAEGAFEGEYIFETSLPEGYIQDQGGMPLKIKVQLGGASLFSNSANEVMVLGVVLNDTNQYAKVDTDGSVSLGTDSDHTISWNPKTGELKLDNVDLETAINGSLGYSAVIQANRTEFTVILNGENTIGVTNNINESFTAIKNAGGGISFIGGEESLHLLSITMEQNGELGSGNILSAIDAADGIVNRVNMEIDVHDVSDESIVGDMIGIQCGTYDDPALSAFINEGDMAIYVNNESLSAHGYSMVQGIVIYKAGMENSGTINIAVETTNGDAYGLRGTATSNQWINHGDGAIVIEATAHGGNVENMNVSYLDSNHSCALSIVTASNIHFLNRGKMELTAVNNGKNGTYEHAIGTELDAGNESILDNQGEIISSGLEGYSYGILLSSDKCDTIMLNSGTITANATTDGRMISGGARALATGVGINTNGFVGKPKSTSLKLASDSYLTASATATENMDSGMRDEVTELYCEAIQLQKMFKSDPNYSGLPQEIELEDGLVIRKGGRCFTVWLEDYVNYHLWIYINTIGIDEDTGPAKYVEIGPVLTPDVDWPDVSLIYGESLAEGDITGGAAYDENGGSLDGDFSWSDSTVIPSVKDSHERTYRMKFKPSAIYGDVYSEVAGNVKVTVYPRELSLLMGVTPLEHQAGQEITLQAQIKGTKNGEVPKGRIQFSANGVRIAQCAVEPGTLTASAEWKDPHKGTYTLTAEYIPSSQDNYIGERTVFIDGYVVKGESTGDGSSDGSNYDMLSSNGHWIKDEKGWRWQFRDGSWARGRRENGLSGAAKEFYHWEIINGAWYAFDEDGYMKEGWIFDAYYNAWFYVDANSGMRTGWQQIDGRWYYFNPVSDGMKGSMLRDTWIDGWYLDKDGICG